MARQSPQQVASPALVAVPLCLLCLFLLLCCTAHARALQPLLEKDPEHEGDAGSGLLAGAGAGAGAQAPPVPGSSGSGSARRLTARRLMAVPKADYASTTGETQGNSKALNWHDSSRAMNWGVLPLSALSCLPRCATLPRAAAKTQLAGGAGPTSTETAAVTTSFLLLCNKRCLQFAGCSRLAKERSSATAANGGPAAGASELAPWR